MSAPTLLVSSRRQFLRLLGLAAASPVAGMPRFNPRLFAAPALFEQVDPSASGITWLHENR